MKNSPDGQGNGAHAPCEIEVIHMRRIADRNPTAWEGSTGDGRKVHVAYLCGELSISLRVAAADGGRRWCEILRLSVARMEAEIRAWQEWKSGRDRQQPHIEWLRRSQLLDVEGREMAERRRANWPKRVVTNGSVRTIRAHAVTLHELRGWLRAREEHFEMLREAGAAGGPCRITLTALGDEC